MVPEYHPVFADTHLVYRVITLEAGLGNLQDLQEDQWATIANLCDRVEELTKQVVEQRETVDELIDEVDRNVDTNDEITRWQKRMGNQLRQLRKFAIRCSRDIQRQFNRQNSIFHNLAKQLKNLKI